jgi:hypothetical protein
MNMWSFELLRLVPVVFCVTISKCYETYFVLPTHISMNVFTHLSLAVLSLRGLLHTRSICLSSACHALSGVMNSDIVL